MPEFGTINFAKNTVEQFYMDLKLTQSQNPGKTIIVHDVDGTPVSETTNLGNQVIRVTTVLPNGSSKLHYMHYTQFNLSVSIETDEDK